MSETVLFALILPAFLLVLPALDAAIVGGVVYGVLKLAGAVRSLRPPPGR